MRRVVITGLGIVSCLGNDKATVTENLRNSRPGIRYNPEYKEQGLRSQVSGSIDLNLEELIDRKVYRFVGHAAAYAYLAMQDAIKDAGLTEEQVSNPRTGLVAGSGGASTLNQMEALDTLREKASSVSARTASPAPWAAPCRRAWPPVQDQGHQLLDLVGLRHLGTLHRHRPGADPVGQAGHRLRRWW